MLFSFLPSPSLSHLPRSALFPYTTLFRSCRQIVVRRQSQDRAGFPVDEFERRHPEPVLVSCQPGRRRVSGHFRSEEHTSELQSPCNLVCRLLLEIKKRASSTAPSTCSGSL